MDDHHYVPAEMLRRIGVEKVSPRGFRRRCGSWRLGQPDDLERTEGERLWRDAIPKMMKQAEEVFDSAEAVQLDMAVDTGAVIVISDGTRFEDPTDP